MAVGMMLTALVEGHVPTQEVVEVWLQVWLLEKTLMMQEYFTVDSVNSFDQNVFHDSIRNTLQIVAVDIDWHLQMTGKYL